MKTYYVRITQQAREQLNGIKSYIEKILLAPEAAYKKVACLQSKIKDLSFMPNRVKLVEQEPYRSQGLHQMRVSNCYVYFWVDEKSCVVQVTGVVYASRDQRAFLGTNGMNEA